MLLYFKVDHCLSEQTTGSRQLQLFYFALGFYLLPFGMFTVFHNEYVIKLLQKWCVPDQSVLSEMFLNRAGLSVLYLNQPSPQQEKQAIGCYYHTLYFTEVKNLCTHAFLAEKDE